MRGRSIAIVDADEGPDDVAECLVVEPVIRKPGRDAESVTLVSCDPLFSGKQNRRQVTVDELPADAIRIVVVRDFGSASDATGTQQRESTDETSNLPAEDPQVAVCFVEGLQRDPSYFRRVRYGLILSLVVAGLLPLPSILAGQADIMTWIHTAIFGAAALYLTSSHLSRYTRFEMRERAHWTGGTTSCIDDGTYLRNGHP